jgi:hypothetical protein
MVSPTRRREAVVYLRDRHHVSERRACRVLGQARATQRYRPRKRNDEAMIVKKMAVKVIQAWPEMTDTKRAQLGITVPDRTSTPVPVPETSPRLEVIAVMGRQIKLKLRPSEGGGRAKPDGVTGANLFYTVGEDYSQDIETWQFKGGQSKTTVTLNIPDSVPGGSKVWLTAQWFNRKAQTGPACPPVETRIAGGLSQAA